MSDTFSGIGGFADSMMDKFFDQIPGKRGQRIRRNWKMLEHARRIYFAYSAEMYGGVRGAFTIYQIMKGKDIAPEQFAVAQQAIENAEVLWAAFDTEYRRAVNTFTCTQISPVLRAHCLLGLTKEPKRLRVVAIMLTRLMAGKGAVITEWRLAATLGDHYDDAHTLWDIMRHEMLT